MVNTEAVRPVSVDVIVIVRSSPTLSVPLVGLKLTDEILGVVASIPGELPAAGEVV